MSKLVFGIQELFIMVDYFVVDQRRMVIILPLLELLKPVMQKHEV